MIRVFTFLLFFTSIAAFSQITGKITSQAGDPIPFASLYIENTYSNASSNDNGEYILPVKEKGKYIIVIQSLGYKIKKINTNVNILPYKLDIVLEEEPYILEEIVITNKIGLTGDEIIKKAIADRKKNSQQSASFEADFYSKGILRIKNVPSKVLGQELGDWGGLVDDSGKGILYLSETVSKVKYQRPNKIREYVVASKVSGDDNGFSYNNAASAEFDFYENYLPFEINVVSPIADNAFEYYNYDLEDRFYSSNYIYENKMVYKIKVSPKRETEPVVSGYIYILEDSWNIYAVDVTAKGSQIKQPLLNTFSIKQNFGYNKKEQTWTKNTQIISFETSLLGIELSGTFNYVYNNFVINPKFEKNTFSNEILVFGEDANNKPDPYWNNTRPIPLTVEEKEDYIKKARRQEAEKSVVYQDSIDRSRNKFRILSPAIGHTYYNTPGNWTINYSGIIKRLGFNTVQAYHLAPAFYFTKKNPDKNTYTTFGTDLNYGFAEKRFRATGTISHKFNNFSKRIVTLSGGSSIEQFNPEKPINRIVNSISTLFFRDNYMKLYDNSFLKLNYEEEVINGIYLYGSIEYARRRSLFNNTNFSTIKNDDKPYLSNNPLLPFDNETPAFLKHSIIKTSVAARISFGQKYWTRPDGKINIPNPKYPRLYLKYEKGFAASIDNYNFDHLSARITHDITFGNKGELGTSFRAGTFFSNKDISFVDYRHFNGNQTHIGKSERYLNVFNFLPYYTHSTSERYFEAHLEHNFKGYITNKIPLFNKLEYHLVAGYHSLSVPGQNYYSEFTIGLDNVGWGKFRFLRVDYIRSYQSGFIGDGVIFGLTFLDILE